MWRNRTTDTEDEPVVVDRNDPVVVDRTKDPSYQPEPTTPERVGDGRRRGDGSRALKVRVRAR